MRSTKANAAVAVLAVIAAVVLFVVLQDDDSGEEPTAAQTTTTASEPTGGGGGGGGEPKEEKPKPKPEQPEVATIVVRDGEPVGGVAELEFTVGDRIRFVVESDVDEEIHLHGYDVYEDVKAGGSAEFDLPATIEGVFEAELHGAVVPVAEISVTPQ